MFKIEDDLSKGYRILKFGNITLLRWYRLKLLFQKFDRLSQIVGMLVTSPSVEMEAQGVMRDIQKIQKVFLDVFAKFAQDNQITYWLDFGTLLGAKRTAGFIPWDDDIDLSVPRIDYQRLISLSQNLPEGYYFASAFNDSLVKLKHKDLPSSIALDLFAVDFIKNDLSLDKTIEITKELFEIQKTTSNKSLNIRKPIYDEYIRSLGINFEPDFERSKMLCYGTEFFHKTHPTIFIHCDYVFPLTSIEFEGKLYPCPKNTGAYLTLIYKDYQKVDWSQMPHLSSDMFTMQELLAINSFVEKNNIH